MKCDGLLSARRAHALARAAVAVMVVVAAGCRRRTLFRRPHSPVATVHDLEPTVTFVGGRAFVAAWMRAREGERGAARELVVRSTRDGGRTWGPEQRVRAASSGYVADPSLATAPGGEEVVLTFLSFGVDAAAGGPRGMHVESARAPVTTLQFGAARPLPTRAGALQLDKPWSTFDAAGRLLVVHRWEGPEARGIDVLTERAEGAFDLTSLAMGAAFDGTLPTICASPGGAAWVAYVDPDPGPRARVVVHRRTAALEWGAPTVVSADDESVAIEAPSCVAPGVEALVAYGLSGAPLDTARSPALDAVQVVAVPQAGKTAAGARLVASIRPGPALLHPLLAGADGRVDLVAHVGPAGDGAADAPDVSGGPHTDAWRVLGPARAPVRVRAPDDERWVLRRADPTWAGDYFGAASDGASLVVVDVAMRAPGHVVFDVVPR